MSDTAKREAIADALGAALAMPEAEQLALLPVRAARGGYDPAAGREAVKRDRGGRPPGAQNLVTRDMLKFVRQVLGDPVLERARWAMHTPESLARELKCSPLEAFDRLDRIRADLQRLFYAPLAPVDGAGNPVAPFFALQIGGGSAPAGPNGAARPPWEYSQEYAQDQALTIEPDAVSHGAVSHETAK